MRYPQVDPISLVVARLENEIWGDLGLIIVDRDRDLWDLLQSELRVGLCTRSDRCTCTATFECIRGIPL